MVRPDSRRRGLGSRLVEYAVELADGKPVYLDSKGHALGMYERLGFSTVGENVKTSELMTPMVRPGRESR